MLNHSLGNSKGITFPFRSLLSKFEIIRCHFICCSEVLNRNWNDTDASILPIYREMIAGGLRIWVFRFAILCLIPQNLVLMYGVYISTWFLLGYCSGDVDSVVPVTATRYSLAQLKLETKMPWYPWYVKKQVSKFILFKSLNFILKGPCSCYCLKEA